MRFRTLRIHPRDKPPTDKAAFRQRGDPLNLPFVACDSGADLKHYNKQTRRLNPHHPRPRPRPRPRLDQCAYIKNRHNARDQTLIKAQAPAGGLQRSRDGSTHLLEQDEGCPKQTTTNGTQTPGAVGDIPDLSSAQPLRLRFVLREGGHQQEAVRLVVEERICGRDADRQVEEARLREGTCRRGIFVLRRDILTGQ
jgi:hypothetical protein